MVFIEKFKSLFEKVRFFGTNSPSKDVRFKILLGSGNYFEAHFSAQNSPKM